MELRDYSDRDEIHILKLFHKAFKKEMTLNYWDWRFKNNPTGLQMLKLMWDKEQLVGHYALSPVHMKVAGERVLTALSMTTMTDPDYEGFGIFTELAETLYQEQHKQNHLFAVWGFPNTKSHYGFVHNLKWKDLAVIPMISIQTDKLKKTVPCEIHAIERFEGIHQSMTEEILQKTMVYVERNAEYLNWRYLQNPMHKYYAFEVVTQSANGFVVCKMIPGIGQPGNYELDLLEMVIPASPRLLLSMLNSLIEYFGKFPVERINCWLSIHHPLYGCLERTGFRCGLPLTYHGIRVLNGNMSPVENPGNWFLSMGDSDVF